ncbi:hypothetical protein BU26DRAFT_591882 [Trematosphaeria pertusa]|uniref:Uncharacterized protein n=1 Tax=Trematosphaeria pertusa TaxID=390896 RepID=A0A6A6IKY3_9PLEO|nr:uncharacterized protein BU26DRAFT_591882 [Trematosphaeria pertusa]KAF2250857.1 hypothetical protein BU26DRAFT_591882 [Trematosphaeria pertusa]
MTGLRRQRRRYRAGGDAVAVCWTAARRAMSVRMFHGRALRCRPLIFGREEGLWLSSVVRGSWLVVSLAAYASHGAAGVGGGGAISRSRCDACDACDAMRTLCCDLPRTLLAQRASRPLRRIIEAWNCAWHAAVSIDPPSAVAHCALAGLDAWCVAPE